MKDLQLSQKEDEKALLVLHKHWFYFIKPLFKFLTIFIFPLLVLTWLFGFGDIIQSTFFSIIYFLWLLVGLTYLFYEWMIWYYDVYIITNKRIVDIEQRSLFSRSVSEASLGKVQDITYQIEGVFATFLNFGTVKIQTAGASGIINLEGIANPEAVASKISQAVEIFEEEEGGEVTVTELLEVIKKQRKSKKDKS